MDYDKNYIEVSYTAEELYDLFIKEFISFRKENNLTQDLFAKYSDVSREKIARIENRTHCPSLLSILKILGPIGYTIKIEKVKKKINIE
ncbi:MAG: helix-turn-helix transcriptional regulator [Firmicutes bacterium]|nr:helix-turn-helix transcriptional regulator [Bacillota bacterium]